MTVGDCDVAETETIIEVSQCKERRWVVGMHFRFGEDLGALGGQEVKFTLVRSVGFRSENQNETGSLPLAGG